MDEEPIKLLGYEKKGDIKAIPLFHFDESSIEVNFKLNPATIKNLEKFKGIVIVGVGKASLVSALESLKDVHVPNEIFMVEEASELMPDKIDRALLILSTSALGCSEKLSKLSHELDFVSRGDMLTEINEKKIFVQSPSRDFNVKGQELIWMKGRKR